MRITYLFFVFFLISVNLSAQETSSEMSVLISSRVDTTSDDVKSVIELYENYFKSKPDSIYDNPFWNKVEKDLYNDFDFSRASIFQNGVNAEVLFKYYSPFVMSVEPIKNDKYQIRVLFSSSTTNPEYVGSKVWCIQKLNAIRENGSWVLENLLVELSSNWTSTKKGFIEYVYPPSHVFNKDAARRAKKFCKMIVRRFNPNFKDRFKYFITSNVDEMGKLENFDYTFVGITTGKAREGMILTAKEDEHYPHEFVHKLLPKNEKRNYIIEEGLAVFLGTKQNEEEYVSIMSKLAKDLSEEPERINFQSVVSQSVKYNGYQTAYPGGAAICELVFELKGDNGLSELMQADTRTYDKLVIAVGSITNLTEAEIELKWKRIVENYAE